VPTETAAGRPKLEQGAKRQAPSEQTAGPMEGRMDRVSKMAAERKAARRVRVTARSSPSNQGIRRVREL
jgi:hypothetical protein